MSWGDERGQSETLAVAIIFVLALTSALVIAGIGSLTLAQTKDVAETEKAVQALTELDSKISLVALEGGDAATIDLNVRGGGRVNVSESGRIRMIVRNDTTTTVLTNTSLGKVSYTNGNQKVAYQGGGVWRRNSDSTGSVMVSPPEVHYEAGTLTLPLIQVTGNERGPSTLRVEKVHTQQVHPDPPNLVNPLSKGTELTVFVTSDYYRGWGHYFEERIGGSVTVFDSNQTIKARLVSPASRFKLGAGLISVGTGDRIEMTGSGCCPTFVDSYNSSEGPYSGPNSSQTSNGTVRGEGGVKLSGNSFINGTVDVHSEVILNGQDTTIRGDVWWRDNLHDPHDGITGENASNGSGVSIPPITSTVNERVSEICPDNSSLDFTGTNGNGTYCVQGNLDFPNNNDTLTLDLSNGNITIAVTGDIDIDQGETIEVINPSGNEVEVWLGGDEIDMKEGTVTVPDDRSPAFRIFGPSDTTVEMSSESRFVGLIFAPGEPGSSGQLKMTSNSSLFGSAVVPAVRMRSGSAVHYDQALGGFSFDRGNTPAAVLSYFYVTINEVKIEPR